MPEKKQKYSMLHILLPNEYEENELRLNAVVGASHGLGDRYPVDGGDFLSHRSEDEQV